MPLVLLSHRLGYDVHTFRVVSLTLLHIDFVNIFSNGILSICGLQVSLFLDHIVRSCDRSIVANVDLNNFITSIKKKVDRFRSTFGTTYEDYV